MSHGPILAPPIVNLSHIVNTGDKRGRKEQRGARGDKFRKTGSADNLVRQRMLLGDITKTVHNMTQLLIGVRNGLVEAQEKMLCIQQELRVLEALCRVGQAEDGLG